MPPPPPLPQPTYNQPPPAITPIANVSADAISSALSALISQPPVPPVVAPPAQTATPPGPDVSQLFQSLVAAGLISGDGSAVPSGASQSQVDSPKIEPIIEPKPVSVDSKLAAMREYEKRLLSLHVSLSASGLQR